MQQQKCAQPAERRPDASPPRELLRHVSAIRAKRVSRVSRRDARAEREGGACRVSASVAEHRECVTVPVLEEQLTTDLVAEFVVGREFC